MVLKLALGLNDYESSSITSGPANQLSVNISLGSMFR